MTDRARRRLLCALPAALLAARSGRLAAETMTTRAVPAGGEALPVIGLGTWQTMDVPASAAALAPLREVLAAFLERGGRVLDTSPMYGRAEATLGQLLAAAPPASKPFVATKVWTTGRAEGVGQIEASERRIGRRLDLVQVHNLVDVETQLDTLDAWKADGRIRYTGITHYTRSAHAELERVAKRRRVDFIQVNYSLAEREAEARLLPFARERGIAVLVNRPFAEGALFSRVRGHDVPAWSRDELGIASWAQYFLKFVVSHSSVTAALPATSKPAHLADNLAAGSAPMPDARQRERMARELDAI